jgi:hypothetical protein
MKLGLVVNCEGGCSFEAVWWVIVLTCGFGCQGTESFQKLRELSSCCDLCNRHVCFVFGINVIGMDQDKKNPRVEKAFAHLSEMLIECLRRRVSLLQLFYVHYLIKRGLMDQ